jgi:hypothetical protein
VYASGVAKEPKRKGRPPAGLEGARVSDYRRMTVWLPGDVYRLLDAMRRARGVPAWRIVVDALRVYDASLPVQDRRLIQHLLTRKS